MKQEIRDSFVQELIKLKNEGKNLAVLVSDSSTTCRIKPFSEAYPDSLINVGIAEQNLVGIAAGLSLGDMIPFTANAAPFLMARSNEQVKTDVCYSNTNVKLVGLNPGFAYGSLGATHHCIDDISITLSYENILVLVPSDPEETCQITRFAAEYEGPVYIRLDSFQSENIHDKEYEFILGEPVFLRKGKDVTMVCLGTVVHEALIAAENLIRQGIDPEIISLPSLRPLDTVKISESLKKTGCCLTIEEHSTRGGTGSVISDIIIENRLTCRLKKLGVPAGHFAHSSPREDLKALYHLNSEGITEEAIKLVREEK